METLLSKETDDIFARMMQINDQNKQGTITEPQTPPVATPAPVGQVPATPASPNVDIPAATAPTPTQAPVAQVDLNAVVDEWDTPVTASATPEPQPATTPVPTTVLPDFSEIAKVLNLGEGKSKDEVIRAAQELKQKAESIGTLPEDLAKAVEIANIGGNYLEYLNVTSVDWAKEDPIVLYENYIIDRFSDEQGNVNTDKVDSLLDKMDENEKELRGRELQSQYIMLQKQQKQNIESQAMQKKAQFEQSVKSALDAFDNVAGFKLSPSHKAELYKEIVSGNDLRHNDLKSRVEMAALRKYWSKMDEYRKTQIKNATLRQTLEEATFPKLNSSSSPAAPTNASNKYGIDDYVKELEQRFNKPQIFQGR